MLPTVQQVRCLIGVVHEFCKALKLRVVSLCTKVRRTIGIRVVGRKGMGDEMVDAPHQQEVRDPLHHGTALCPTVRAEFFAQCSPLHLGILMGEGSTQLTQNVMIKRRIADAGSQAAIMDMVRHAGHNLMQDDVNSRHILPFQRPEVVSRTAAGSCVAVIVLDDMTDVHDTVVAAPVSYQIAEIIPIQAGDGIHIGQSCNGSVLTTEPQLAQIGDGILSHFSGHIFDHLGGIRKRDAHRAQRALMTAGIRRVTGCHAISKRRFV